MNRSDDDLREAWPDQDEWNRWQDALAGTTMRLKEERGIEEPWRLTVGWGALWAEYGDLRLRIGGDGVEVAGPDDLFGEVDHWVAFGRMAGPGRVLDRDRQFVAEWRQRLPAVRQFWEEVARHVFRDVDATTDLHLPWNVVIREDEPDWPAIPVGVDGGIGVVGGMAFVEGLVSEPGRRPLNLPEVWIETPHTGRSLPAMDDEAEAIGYLADMVQDDIIDEIHGAWPQCPRHPHPLEVHYSDTGHPTWNCPKTSDIEVAIGELERLGGSSA